LAQKKKIDYNEIEKEEYGQPTEFYTNELRDGNFP
jgi:hypothetical protein